MARRPPSSSTEAGQDVLLPHDRDETAGPEGTAGATLHQESRDTLEQAGKDVERGLKDTERRGIPSDVPQGTRKKRT